MFSVEPLKFKHPFTCMMAGPSQSGKSTLLAKILTYNKVMITPQPDCILYCYSRWSDGFNQLKYLSPTIEFKQGLPEIETLNVENNNLLILDDLMSEAEKSRAMLELFTTDSHHANISVFLISQNLFSQGKFSRTISLNCQYMIVFNNPRDKAQIHALSRQMYPTNPPFLIECYEDATSTKFGYLFLDLTQSTDNQNRVQTGITPNDERIIYQPKKSVSN